MGVAPTPPDQQGSNGPRAGSFGGAAAEGTQLCQKTTWFGPVWEEIGPPAGRLAAWTARNRRKRVGRVGRVARYLCFCGSMHGQLCSDGRGRPCRASGQPKLSQCAPSPLSASATGTDVQYWYSFSRHLLRPHLNRIYFPLPTAFGSSVLLLLIDLEARVRSLTDGT